MVIIACTRCFFYVVPMYLTYFVFSINLCLLIFPDWVWLIRPKCVEIVFCTVNLSICSLSFNRLHPFWPLNIAAGWVKKRSVFIICYLLIIFYNLRFSVHVSGVFSHEVPLTNPCNYFHMTFSFLKVGSLSEKNIVPDHKVYCST